MPLVGEGQRAVAGETVLADARGADAAPHVPHGLSAWPPSL